jgi:DNA end-binding protein Ku
MASQLVGTLAEDFEPAAFQDTYRDAVLDLVKRKSKGEEIDLMAEEEPAQGDDLAAALQASLAGARS